MKALFDSLVRTFTPIIVGAVLGWFTTSGIELDPEFQGALTLLVGAALSGLYYIAVRLLETYVTPKFGWLLGLAKQPLYLGKQSGESRDLTGNRASRTEIGGHIVTESDDGTHISPRE